MSRMIKFTPMYETYHKSLIEWSNISFFPKESKILKYVCIYIYIYTQRVRQGEIVESGWWVSQAVEHGGGGGVGVGGPPAVAYLFV